MKEPNWEKKAKDWRKAYTALLKNIERLNENGKKMAQYEATYGRGVDEVIIGMAERIEVLEAGLHLTCLELSETHDWLAIMLEEATLDELREDAVSVRAADFGLIEKMRRLLNELPGDDDGETA